MILPGPLAARTTSRSDSACSSMSSRVKSSEFSASFSSRSRRSPRCRSRRISLRASSITGVINGVAARLRKALGSPATKDSRSVCLSPSSIRVASEFIAGSSSTRSNHESNSLLRQSGVREPRYGADSGNSPSDNLANGRAESAARRCRLASEHPAEPGRLIFSSSIPW